MLSKLRIFWARSSAVIGWIFLLSAASPILAETPIVLQSPVLGSAPMNSQGGNQLSGMSSEGLAARRESAGELEVVEAPRDGFSLDRSRRELYRYPDQDLLGRFIEWMTELPPLLGARQD